MSERVGLLLCRDLFFTSKVTGTASALGVRMSAVGGWNGLFERMARERASLIVVDIGDSEFAHPERLAELRSRASSGEVIVAFGPHVDAESLTAARAAGFDAVLPRSRFSAELARILAEYLGKEMGGSAAKGGSGG